MAASAPPTPTEALALVSDPTSSLCGNFVRTLLRLPVLFYNLIYWLIDESGVGVRTYRAGDMIPSFSSTSDEHRLLCNGQAINKNDYPELYAAIGNAFDTMPDEHGTAQAAPGGDLFRVPRCGGRFPVGTGNFDSGATVAVGGTGGEEKHVLTASELAKHTHKVWPDDDGDGNTGKLWSHFDASGESWDTRTEQPLAPSDDGTTTTTLIAEEQADGDVGHNTLPPYFGVYIFICTGR